MRQIIRRRVIDASGVGSSELRLRSFVDYAHRARQFSCNARARSIDSSRIFIGKKARISRPQTIDRSPRPRYARSRGLVDELNSSGRGIGLAVSLHVLIVCGASLQQRASAFLK
ncbi:hypothetical protein V5799_015417 [Amblyomma americanum]|uniref:Uncharacterized protein n=1 Tax=Amblyomma americanum TaxID=6943 RepID=A0AAQ4F8Q9_AMBAM